MNRESNPFYTRHINRFKCVAQYILTNITQIRSIHFFFFTNTTQTKQRLQIDGGAVRNEK